MKKIISALLAVLMLAGALSVAAGAQTFVNDETYVVGNVDASSDKEVNALDVYAIRSYLVGESVNIDRQAADMDANDKIDAVDVYNLRCLLVGLKTGSDFDNGRQVYKFTIGRVNISEFRIYVPEDAVWNDNVQYAAEIFQRYTRISCGTELEIVKGAHESGHGIVFNLVDRKSELGQKLGAEGYRYDVTDGNLNVYGTYRGNMYAVYEILEDYLGLRFYDNEYTFQYKTRIVDIPEGTNQFVTPKMKFRFCGQNVKKGPETYYMPSRQNGTQVHSHSEARYGLQYGPQYLNAHSYDYYWQMATGTMPDDDGKATLEERYRAKLEDGEKKFRESGKNEYDWQPCATDSSSYDTLFEGMLLMLNRIENWGSACYAFTTTAKNLVAEGQKSVSFSLCDNETYCTCRPCGRKANGVINKNGEVVVPREGYGALYLDMANKAAVDIQQYYPGMRIHCILYNHDIPETIRPDKNVIVFYCGQGCNNHYLNSGECKNLGQLGKENNIKTAASLKAWGSFCAETGAEMWYWYYGVTYHYYMVSMPSVYNIYYDYKYMYEECNVRGIYYEGSGDDPEYNYETLKAYLSTRMEWEPDMSYEKFIEYMKEYLYMYYGAGYEEMYQFIDMENTAGNECGTCFISNFDRPGDMYSYAYIDEYYEEMRELLTAALDKAEREDQKERIRIMLICFDFLGLSSSYDRMYTNGDAASRALYEQRYTDMFNELWRRDMKIFSDPGTYSKPKEIDFTVNPTTQFYEFGSRRPGVKP